MIYCFRKDNGELSELTGTKDAVLGQPLSAIWARRIGSGVDALNIPGFSYRFSRRRWTFPLRKDEETIFNLISSPVLNDDDREMKPFTWPFLLALFLQKIKLWPLHPRRIDSGKFMKTRLKLDPNDVRDVCAADLWAKCISLSGVPEKATSKRNLIEQVLQ